MNPVAIRLLNQQLICQQFATPAQVVDYMGAIQAQEYRMMRWAVEMRTVNPSREAFKKAFDSGQIVRLHLMRGTWQLVSAADYYPLLKLCGSKALSVIKGWMSSNKISIPEHEVAKIRPILVRAAEKSGSATKEDFVQALSEKDISMDEHRLSYHIRLAELDKLFGRRARRRVFEPVTPVHADEKSHLFARRGELRRRSARADLDVVGVRAEEQVSLVLLDPRQRCGKRKGKRSQTHVFLTARRSRSSSQMRSYSGSSSL